MDFSKLSIAGSLLLVSAAAILAQDGKTSFEVISIKPVPSGAQLYWSPLPGGKFMARAITVRLLLEMAFHVQDFDLEQAPDWVNQEGFDIDAAPGRAIPDSGLPVAIRSMLEDRFKLVAHVSPKEMPGYSLVLAAGDPKFHPAVPRAEGEKWGIRPTVPSGIAARDESMADVAIYLSNTLRAPVADNTELKGRYDFSLTWDPHATGAGLPDTAGETIFSTLQSQLGLRLKSAKIRRDTLVIDHIERPSPN